MLEGLEPPSRQNSCRVQQVADTLDPKDQEILKESVMNPDWPISTLSRELQKRGITLGEKPMTAHRKGHCQCSKD
jgi:hypothetical protein